MKVKRGTMFMKILRKTLHIGGMSCVNCEHRIRYVLKTAPGIQDATVSYNTGLAHVTYDTDTISLKQIREIIEKTAIPFCRKQEHPIMI